MAYTLPNLTLEQFKRLSEEEQFLLMQSILSVYSTLGGDVDASGLRGLPVSRPQTPRPRRQSLTVIQGGQGKRSNQAPALILSVLRQQPGLKAPEIQQIVSQQTRASAASVRVSLARLVQKGLVEKVYHDGNRRSPGYRVR